jgi:autotransporter-associated beta strand protein/T5SS/PEP-CTERM-associated repeat protein
MSFSNVRDARSVRLLGLIAVALLFVATAPVDLRADTTLDSGTTTVTTGTDFGTNLYVGFSGTATLEVVAGGSAASQFGTLGDNAGSLGIATVSGGTWTNTAALTVGHWGVGLLDVAGGTLNTYDCTIGSDVGYSTATVTSGTLIAVHHLTIGAYRGGTLVISGGEVITGVAYLSELSYTVGTATISGGTWSINNLFFDYGGGTGTLNVNGGLVHDNICHMGWSDISTASATVTSGTWANDTMLVIGTGGTGTLNVSGGLVTSGNGYIGGSSSGVGTVTVSSGTWANNTDLVVGNSGTGTLNVSGGSVTNANNGYIGYDNGSVGTVTVLSGTWTASSDLWVGYTNHDDPDFPIDGTGTLTLNGGIVTVGSMLSKGSLGTINLNFGGTLQIGTGTTSGVLGVSTLANNGMLIFNRSDASTYAGTISGSGAVMKQGAGTLTLSGSNGVSGPTTIQQGVLNLGNSAALASSALTPLSGGTVTLTPYLQTSVGGLNPHAGGLVDVGNGMVTVATGLAASDLVAALVSGYGDGTWSGTSGMTSSTAAGDVTIDILRAVGWLDNGDGSMTFGYAAPGDTNLDGVVDMADAANILSGGMFDTDQASSWIQGDFNYDGLVDVLDAAAFNTTNLYDAGPYNTPTSLAVPEPPTWAATVAGVVSGGCLLLRRRR